MGSEDVTPNAKAMIASSLATENVLMHGTHRHNSSTCKSQTEDDEYAISMIKEGKLGN